MSFLIKDDEEWEKREGIKFHSEPAYDKHT